MNLEKTHNQICYTHTNQGAINIYCLVFLQTASILNTKQVIRHCKRRPLKTPQISVMVRIAQKISFQEINIHEYGYTYVGCSVV